MSDEIIEQITSENKTQANRENAQKSTGPRTDAGKAIVSRNAVRHGLLSNSLTFDSDDEREIFEQFRADIQEELAPQGIVENMLVAEIAVSWWKQQVAQRWSMQEISSRRKAAIVILRACAASSGLTVNPFSDSGTAEGISGSGWDCKELTIKVGAQRPDDDLLVEPEEVKPQVQFEAKLGTSAETFLRYESAWKKDMYRALATLKNVQQARLAKSGGAKA
jgi:hypothetical protein